MITIRQIQELQEVEHFEPLEKAVNYISIVRKMSIDKVEEMPMNKIMSTYKDILTELENYPKEPKYKFKINGRRFQMIHNAMDISADQFISLQQYTPQEIVINLHRIMATLTNEVNWYGKVKPIKNKREHFEQLCEMFLDLDFHIANSYAVFFSLLYPKLLDATLSYLQTEMKKAEELQTQTP